MFLLLNELRDFLRVVLWYVFDKVFEGEAIVSVFVYHAHQDLFVDCMVFGNEAEIFQQRAQLLHVVFLEPLFVSGYRRGQTHLSRKLF